jgi:BMFP domain-containing protein YqiC
MSEYVWETFDALFDIVERQGRIVAELEARIARLEEKLEKREQEAA